MTEQTQIRELDGKQGSELLMMGLDGGLLSEGFYASEVESLKEFYASRGKRIPRNIQNFIDGGFKPTHREVWTWHAARSWRNEGAEFLEKADCHTEEIK
jgi:hypothetical protein